jgi:hypothetical protein
MMINLPPDIFNRMTGQQPQQQGGTFTPSGGAYSGPFGNDTRTPFRTVEGIGQYGNGLNSSAAQFYDHFRGSGRAAMHHGLPMAGEVQSLSDFANRGALSGPATSSSGKLAFEDLTDNNSVLKFMGQDGGMSAGDLDWMGRWFNESGTGGNKAWVDGSLRGWDYKSDLTPENRAIATRAENYMSNYWKPWEEQGAGMPADPQPTMPSMGGGIFNMPPGGFRI